MNNEVLYLYFPFDLNFRSVKTMLCHRRKEFNGTIRFNVIFFTKYSFTPILVFVVNV